MVAALLLLLTASGCQALGLIAAKMPPATIDAGYKGLTNQKTGVLVWADNSITRDFANIQQDLAGGVTSIIETTATGKDKPDYLEGASFMSARTLRRYQKDHPEMDAKPIDEVAPNLGVSRLIYVQIDDFQTRASNAYELYRGSLKATVRVFEIEGGKVKEAFHDPSIRVVFPDHVSDDGTPNGNDDAMYVGTLRAASFEVAKHFVPHQEED